MRTVTKIMEEGHISRLRNMLKPMSPSSFFPPAPLTSIKTFWTLCRLFLLSPKQEGTLPEERRPKWPRIHREGFRPAKFYVRCFFFFPHTVRHILYTNVAKKNIDIVIFFFYSLYKGMNLWSWLK